MQSLNINKPAASMPRWAILEREYLRLVTQAPKMLSDYLTPEGRIFWPQIDEFPAFGGVDNVFEGFQSFPLLYMLGADDCMLEFADREFRVLTEQFNNTRRPNVDPKLVEMGRDTMLVDGVMPDADWMHIAENNMFVYHLLLADPTNAAARENILKQAQYHFGDSPVGLPRNYDPEYKVFASSHVGSNGPVTTGFDKPYDYASWLEYYGLPYYDVPGVVTLLDLKDPEKAARFGKVYGERQSNSDTVSNLYCASLAVNAYMLTGNRQFRDFVLDYVGAWRKRAEDCEIMPDNAGPHGIVGETMGGRFYGSRYGWTHPHGYGTVNDAVIVGCEAERFFTGDKHSIDTARDIVETLVSRYGVPSPDGGIIFPTKRADDGSIIEYRHDPNAPFVEPAQVADEPGYVRFRQRDGWYEYGHAATEHLAHICAASFDPADEEWMEKIASPKTLSVTPERWGGKSKANNHGGFARYLAGRYPEYPEEVMEHSIMQFYKQAAELNAEKNGAVRGFGYRPSNEAEWNMLRAASEEMRRTTGIRFDDSVVHSYYQTFLLSRSPLSAEGLLNLTMGAQYPIYNGGMIHAQLRWFDAERRRPGLPEDVAVLVTSITEEQVTVTLANTSAVDSRTMIMQAGTYGEHDFVSVTIDGETTEVGSRWAQITLAPGTVAEMTIVMKRYVREPNLDEPISRT